MPSLYALQCLTGKVRLDLDNGCCELKCKAWENYWEFFYQLQSDTIYAIKCQVSVRLLDFYQLSGIIVYDTKIWTIPSI